jgi:Family of unknown function (DUF6074)
MTDDPRQGELFPSKASSLQNQRSPDRVEKKLVISDPEIVPCQMIPFPLNRRAKKIRYAAKTFVERTTDEKKQRFWDQTVNQLGSQLNRFGITDAEIDKQIAAFRNAVSDEIFRQAQTSQSKGSRS